MSYQPSLLWELKSGNGFRSYLFGSIHISGFGQDELKKSLTAFIQSCNCCALEISLEQVADINLFSYQFLDENSSALNYIQAKKWNRLAEQLSLIFNFDLYKVKNLKPLLLLNLIIQKYCSDKGDAILDEWIWTYAKSQHKLMLGLESIEEHFDVLDKIKLSSQYNMFYKSLSNLPKFKKKLLGLIENYKEQDIRTLYKQAKNSAGDSKHKLLTERNFVIADHLFKIIEEDTCFALVGAAHLYGKFGLLNLIKKKNIALKPIKINL